MVQGVELLERELDNLNCYSNDAVTLDLTKDAYGENGQLPCCKEHKNHSKVSVEPVSVNHAHHDHHHVGSENLTVKKYSIDGGSLAAIKLAGEKKKNRKRIKFDNGPKFPITGPVEISALYSGNNKEPVLIYVGKNGNQNPTGWYRSGSSNTWTRATGLDSVTPENITECANWNNLVKELKYSDSDLQECKEAKQDKQQEAQRSGSEESEGQGYKADAGGKEAKKDEPVESVVGSRENGLGEPGQGVDTSASNYEDSATVHE
ncbi:hypothetical protein BEWA_035790 [Theileria equi strain WA]|uniref:Uncharacterized protein n=1 Tax=Theileria equi strain WA TaxID=1537102 RepID=L1LEE1_THEEQ|nr:hypothetical protein BEWA_035790 [Theileria equi strain WA]EKX73543.1 hypothetical protein BEWA_035790 [Theileria equi strain WA]|eukprot:XP_004832995.1 hypothetical protein BEWA_035790 [Theileria equi strain WA]